MQGGRPVGPGLTRTNPHRYQRSPPVKIGVPTEVKNHEYRVGITPVGVHELVAHGHEVLIQKGAGLGSSISYAEFSAQGARILEAADDVWAEAEMGIKVKERIAQEYHRLREGLVLFTYLMGRPFCRCDTSGAGRQGSLRFHRSGRSLRW